MLPGLHTIWVFIESPMVLETGNPVSSDLAGFRFWDLLILTLGSNTAQRLELLFLSVELVAQPAVCRSGNNTGDFPGGLAVGVHSFSPEMIDLIFGFGTTRVVFISLIGSVKQNGRCPVGTAPIGYCGYSISLLVLVADRCYSWRTRHGAAIIFRSCTRSPSDWRTVGTGTNGLADGNPSFFIHRCS